MPHAPTGDKLYYRIGEVEELTGVPPHVLRYWESEFKLLRPRKNPAGQRVYRRPDVDLVLRIKSLLYEERLTLEGARKRLGQGAGRDRRQLALDLPVSPRVELVRRIRDRLVLLRGRLAVP